MLRNFGRVVLCGTVSGYARSDDPAGGADLTDAVFRRITLHGYIASDYYPAQLLPIARNRRAAPRGRSARW